MKTLSPRILRQVTPDPRYLSFEVNTRISENHINNFDLPLRKSSDRYLEEVGPRGAALVRRVNDILGCKWISLTQYSVQIVVAGAFNPTEDGITDDVIEAVKDCFGYNRDQVEVVTLTT